MVLYPNPAGRADVSGLNFFFNCVRFALLHTRRVGSCLSNASAPPTFLFFPCTSMVLSVTTSGVWLDLHMGPHAPPEPLPRSASPARGPHLVLGGCFDLSFLPRHLPSQESVCTTPSSPSQRSAFETLPCRTDHSRNTSRFCRGSLSPPPGSRQPGPVPASTAPGPGPCGFLPCPPSQHSLLHGLPMASTLNGLVSANKDYNQCRGAISRDSQAH